jgi:hypothetical protein
MLAVGKKQDGRIPEPKIATGKNHRWWDDANRQTGEPPLLHCSLSIEKLYQKKR